MVTGSSSQDDNSQLSKQSCHDSGIDIRDPIPVVPPVVTKKNYSDADMVLSSEWAPPLTIAPTIFTDTLSTAQSLDAGGAVTRKKTSSVSFSVDDQAEQQQAGSTSSDKTSDNKKNKMLKRLSYPLTWVEGLASDGKPAANSSAIGGSASESDSAPNTGDSNQSVFSKVFSR